ncbi:recombinase family protein [Exiguobacterium sp. s142]|uniref:recombinase family protein n=1 Tax=Exiguobacterium sp. s142 TaxID=2751222 RepID=UPI001BE76DB8|nr:recombinase family protein [Exiguobacterium sp. s142]
MDFGYMRVSSKSQNLDRQYDALKDYVPFDDHIYSDKASGKDMEREGFQNLLKVLRSGDTLYIKSIDRLGRNKEQIKEYLQYFKTNKIRLKIIDMPTTMRDSVEGNDNIMDMVNSILLEVYTTLAQQEREMIKQRQREGIEVAKKNGKHLGRPAIELPKEWDTLYKRWKDGEIKGVEFMDAVNMKKPTFYKKVREYEEAKGLREGL